MTGELADLFATRQEGVARLVDAVARGLPATRLQFYAGPRGFTSAAEAPEYAPWIASANWYATASLAAPSVVNGVLVDVGSTTTDVVPLRDGQVSNRGYSDGERMAVEELVYQGVARTPLMALGPQAPVGGEWLGLAAEHFAQTADVYRLLGTLPERVDMDGTADGRGTTPRETRARLARMVGMDEADAGPDTWLGLARYFSECQLERLGRACARQLSAGIPPDAPLVGAGIGRFLVRELARRLDRCYVDITELTGPVAETPGLDGGDCAPAAAVAVLACREAPSCHS